EYLIAPEHGRDKRRKIGRGVRDDCRRALAPDMTIEGFHPEAEVELPPTHGRLVRTINGVALRFSIVVGVLEASVEQTIARDDGLRSRGNIRNGKVDQIRRVVEVAEIGIAVIDI